MKKEITLKLNLAPDDLKGVFEKAYSHGLTISELLENFIYDLVGAGNGSDERDLADQYFNRCWFGMFPEMTFINYLAEYHDIDRFTEYLEDRKSTQDDIKATEAILADDNYPWKDIFYFSYEGCEEVQKQRYQTREEFEQEYKDELEALKDDLQETEEAMKEMYEDFLSWTDLKEKPTFEQCIEQVEQYRSAFDDLTQGKEGANNGIE